MSQSMRLVLVVATAVILLGCQQKRNAGSDVSPAVADTPDTILVNARVYTMRWSAPDGTGAISDGAPVRDGVWQPDAEAVAIADGRITFVGASDDAMRLAGSVTRVVDLQGAVLLPGLVDSHTHVFDLGTLLDEVNLIDVPDEETAVALIVERARNTPAGEWIVGRGWDDGAWANRYPDKALLTQAVPDHPVMMASRHGFAAWGNQMALDVAGITSQSDVPVGGEMPLGDDGEPTGLFLNRGVTMLSGALPQASPETLTRQVLLALNQMAEDGFTAVHDAGLDAERMRILEALEAQGRLPIRVYAMLSLRDEPLIRQWLQKGPDGEDDSMLVTRAVKAYYDGALGSRGARLLDDYSDMPGHRGVSGGDYGFNQALMADAMRAGFQIGIHAIGDAGNREALDILESVFRESPGTAKNRHRIEHAQVLAETDFPRLAQHGIIASMEPPHAMEDKAWAEDRLGPERIRRAYAWRTMRKAGVHLTFNSDNPGSSHNIFYGLHSAITRRDRALKPESGWYPEQRVNIDEAVRAYTSWSAYAGFSENQAGVITEGMRADLTAMDIDPFALATTAPERILDGEIVMTLVDGRIVFE